MQVVEAREREACPGRSRFLVIGHRHGTCEGHVAGILDNIAVADHITNRTIGCRAGTLHKRECASLDGSHCLIIDSSKSMPLACAWASVLHRTAIEIGLRDGVGSRADRRGSGGKSTCRASHGCLVITHRHGTCEGHVAGVLDNVTVVDHIPNRTIRFW